MCRAPWSHLSPRHICIVACEASHTDVFVVQCYLFMHAEHGTVALFPWYGAKGGKKGEAGGMWDGFRFWFKDSPQRDVQWLHDILYGNQQAGLAACQKAAPARYAKMSGPVTAATEIDPDCWMVRIHSAIVYVAIS